MSLFVINKDLFLTGEISFMKLIIQIPCYNEAETLEIALNALPKHIDGIDVIEYLIIRIGSRIHGRN